jgi:hypothetical protein
MLNSETLTSPGRGAIDLALNFRVLDKGHGRNVPALFQGEAEHIQER